jgi:AraC-like DNA-binding protein
MDRIHLAKIGFLTPVLDGLREAGAPLGTLTRAAGLDRFHLDDPEGYIPVDRQLAFYDVLSNREGIPDIAAQFRQRIRLSTIGDWGQATLAEPDLLTACLDAQRYASLIETHFYVHLQIDGPRARLSAGYRYRPGPGIRQSEHMSLLVMLDALRVAAGPDFVADEIHLTDDRLQGMESTLNDVGKKVLTGQQEIAVLFPTRLLACRMRRQGTASDFASINGAGNTTAERIERLLDDSVAGSLTSLPRIADSLGSPPRTLQRYLAEDGTSFSAVLEKWRFKRSVEALQSTSTSVAGIAEQLGYANTPNFVRAFRRWTNSSPTEYRESVLNS